MTETKRPEIGGKYRNKNNGSERVIAQIIYFADSIGFVFENSDNFLMKKVAARFKDIGDVKVLYAHFFENYEEVLNDAK